MRSCLSLPCPLDWHLCAGNLSFQELQKLFSWGCSLAADSPCPSWLQISPNPFPAMNVWSLASMLLSASFVFYALGEKSFFLSPFSDFFPDKGTQGQVGPRRSNPSCCTCSCLHTPCTCLPSLFLTLHNPRNSSSKIFSSAISWRWPRLSPAIQRKRKAGHRVFLWTGASCWSLIHAHCSFWRCPRFLLWSSTVCKWLLRLCSAPSCMARWPTYLSFSACPSSSGPPFSTGDNKGETFHYLLLSTFQSLGCMYCYPPLLFICFWIRAN